MTTTNNTRELEEILEILHEKVAIGWLKNEVRRAIETYDRILANGWSAERLHEIIKEDLSELNETESSND